jgi:hypothetical protein
VQDLSLPLLNPHLAASFAGERLFFCGHEAVPAANKKASASVETDSLAF